MSNPTTTSEQITLVAGLCKELRELRKELQEMEAELIAEREVGGNTIIALAQQITKLEDQLAVAVEALKLAKRELHCVGSVVGKDIDAVLEKIGGAK